MKPITLIALDLDGTLFNSKSIISKENLQTIRCAVDSGVTVVISTGRPYSGLPLEQLKGTGIQYAITTNGSAIYEIDSRRCVCEECIPNEISFPIIEFLLTKDMHFDAFIQGNAYSPNKCLEAARQLQIPDSLKKYIIDSRIRVDDILAYITDHHLQIQKMTLNFHPDENGVLIARQEVKEFLLKNPAINVVCGGFNNLEFTKAGIDKGVGLSRLAEYLHIPMEQTMAIGDTENDLAILKAAAVGVAMENAPEEIKQQADYVTLSNDKSGVAAAIQHFLFPI